MLILSEQIKEICESCEKDEKHVKKTIKDIAHTASGCKIKPTDAAKIAAPIRTFMQSLAELIKNRPAGSKPKSYGFQDS